MCCCGLCGCDEGWWEKGKGKTMSTTVRGSTCVVRGGHALVTLALGAVGTGRRRKKEEASRSRATQKKGGVWWVVGRLGDARLLTMPRVDKLANGSDTQHNQHDQLNRVVLVLGMQVVVLPQRPRVSIRSGSAT